MQQKEIITSCHLTIHENSIYGLLGPNGAGKTTLYKLLTDYIHATSGTIEILGMGITTERNNIIKNIGSMIEAPVFYEHLSATQNIKVHLSYMGLVPKNIPLYLEMVGLHQTGDKPELNFSLECRNRLVLEERMQTKPKI